MTVASQRTHVVHTCRAYGGPAHGFIWAAEADAPPPDAVDIDDSNLVYRLIRRPGTGTPALDHLGNYLYMPVLPSAAGDSDPRHLSDPVPIDHWDR